MRGSLVAVPAHWVNGDRHHRVAGEPAGSLTGRRVCVERRSLCGSAMFVSMARWLRRCRGGGGAGRGGPVFEVRLRHGCRLGLVGPRARETRVGRGCLLLMIIMIMSS